MSSLIDLIDLFSKFPGLGPRSARRIVLHLLKNKDRLIPNTTELLNSLKSSIVICEICGNIDSETLVKFVYLTTGKRKSLCC